MAEIASNFNKLSVAAQAISDIAGSEKVAHLLATASKAKKAGNRSDDEPATSKQLGLVAHLANLDGIAREEWYAITEMLRLRKSHIGFVIATLNKRAQEPDFDVYECMTEIRYGECYGCDTCGFRCEVCNKRFEEMEPHEDIDNVCLGCHECSCAVTYDECESDCKDLLVECVECGRETYDEIQDSCNACPHECQVAFENAMSKDD